MYQNEPYQARAALTTDRIHGYSGRIFRGNYFGIGFAVPILQLTVTVFPRLSDTGPWTEHLLIFQKVGAENSCAI